MTSVPSSTHVHTGGPADEPRADHRLLTSLGQRTRRLRVEQHLTLRELSRRSGLSPRFLMDVEAGRGNISVRRLGDLAGALGTTPADLVTVDAPRRPTLVALLGLRGAGKTAVGRKLARRHRVPFVELDRQIEAHAGMMLGEVFSLHGEEYYRRLEREVLEALLAERRPMILAVGGGLVTAADTYALLRRHATTVWLRARPEDYWQRVMRQGDRRPMDEHPRAQEALRDLVRRREALYAEADLRIDTSDLAIPAVVDQVDVALRRAGLAPGTAGRPVA